MIQNTTIDLIFDDWRYLSIYLYDVLLNTYTSLGGRQKV